jgi:hypothetical protein
LRAFDRATPIQLKSQFFAHMLAQRGKFIDRDTMLATDGAQCKQAFLDRVHAALVRIDRRTRGRNFADSLGGLHRRALQRRRGAIQHAACLIGHAREVPLRLAQGILDIVLAGKLGRCRVQCFDKPFGMHQAGTLLGQFFFFARLRVQLRQFRQRMFQKFPVLRGFLRTFGGRPRSLGRLAPGLVGLTGLGHLAAQPAKPVEQGAMGRGVNQPARFELALDFDQRLANLAQQADTGRLVVDKGAATSVGAQYAPQHQLYAGIVQPLLGQQHAGGMVGTNLEHGGNHRALRAVPHQSALGPRVSPVSTQSPFSNERSSRAIRTTSRIDRAVSIAISYQRSLVSVRYCPSLAGDVGCLRQVTFFGCQHILTVQKGPAVLVPFTVREIMPQDGSREARLFDNAKRHIGFGQTVQGLRHMGRGAPFLDNTAKSSDRGQMMFGAQVIATDVHVLASQMVVGQVDFQSRIAGIVAFWKTSHKIFESRQSFFGHELVARYVGYLFVIAQPLEVPSIGRVLVAGMKIDEAVQRDNRVVIFTFHIMGIPGHDLRLGSPFGIGVLALDFIKRFGGQGISAALHVIHGFVINVFHRTFDIGHFFIVAGTTAQRQGE